MQSVARSVAACDIDTELKGLEESISKLSLGQRESFSQLAKHNVRPVESGLTDLRGRVVSQRAQLDHQAYRLGTIFRQISDLRASDSNSLVSFLQRHRVQEIMVRLYLARATDMLALVQSKNYRIALETYCAVELANTNSVADIQRLFDTVFAAREKAGSELKDASEVVLFACGSLYKGAFFLLKLMMKKYEGSAESKELLGKLKDLASYDRVSGGEAYFPKPLNPVHDPHFTLDLMQHVSLISRMFSLYDLLTMQFCAEEVAGLANEIFLTERHLLSNLDSAARGECCNLLQGDDVLIQRCRRAIGHFRAVLEQKLVFNPLVPPLLSHLDGLEALTFDAERINSYVVNVHTDAHKQLVSCEEGCAKALSQLALLECAPHYLQTFNALSVCSPQQPVLTRALTEKVTEVFSEGKRDNEIFLHILARNDLRPLYQAGEFHTVLPKAVMEYLVRAIMRMRYTVQQRNIRLDLAIGVLRTCPVYANIFAQSLSERSFQEVIGAYDTDVLRSCFSNEDLDAACRFFTSTQDAVSKAKDPVAYAKVVQHCYNFSEITTSDLLALLKQVVQTLLHRCAEENKFVIPSESIEAMSAAFSSDLSRARSSLMRALSAAIAAKQEDERSRANKAVLSYIDSLEFSKIVTGYETTLEPLIFENTFQKLTEEKYDPLKVDGAFSKEEIISFFTKGLVANVLETGSVPFLKSHHFPLAIFRVVRDIDKFDESKPVPKQASNQTSTGILFKKMGEKDFLTWYRQMASQYPSSPEVVHH